MVFLGLPGLTLPCTKETVEEAWGTELGFWGLVCGLEPRNTQVFGLDRVFGVSGCSGRRVVGFWGF